jgi:hypothetical protein
MLDVHSFMVELARKRAVFHSEADFQHAFAWQLQQQYPSAQIRLEFPYVLDRGIYIDIWSEIDGKQYAIELKYKTSRLQISHSAEPYNLKNHAAQPLGRYDFLKDVHRLELVTECAPKTIGYAIMLTNDPGYWKQDRLNTIDSAFRLSESRELSGVLRWGEDASVGTTKTRNEPLMLKRKYVINWLPYSSVANTGNGMFQYCALTVVQD